MLGNYRMLKDIVLDGNWGKPWCLARVMLKIMDALTLVDYMW
jgi:hypothetical protein